MPKRPPKKSDAKETAARKAFVEALEAVQEKHGYQVVPMLNYSYNGIRPELGIRKQSQPE